MPNRNCMFNINSNKTKSQTTTAESHGGTSNAFFSADHPLASLAICFFFHKFLYCGLDSSLDSDTHIEVEFLTLKCSDIYCRLWGAFWGLRVWFAATLLSCHRYLWIYVFNKLHGPSGELKICSFVMVNYMVDGEGCKGICFQVVTY